MIREAESVNVPISLAENGKNLHDNLLNAVDAGEQSTAARIVRKMHGFTIAIGVPEVRSCCTVVSIALSLLHSSGAFSLILS